MVELRLLGTVEVARQAAHGAAAELTQPRRLALLLYLALAEPPGLHSRQPLMALLWPEADEASARHSLRNALHSLRRVLGSDAIVTRGGAYVGLDFAALRCDAVELRSHLAAGEVEEALALWKGDLAPGFHVSGAPQLDEWLEGKRTSLRNAVRAAAWKRAQELEGAGSAEVDAVRHALQLDPGNEPGTRRLMGLLAGAGDRGGALQAYEQLAAWLAREVEAEPSEKTRALAAHLRGPARSPTHRSQKPSASTTAGEPSSAMVSALPPYAEPGPPPAPHAYRALAARWRALPAILAAAVLVLSAGGWLVLRRGDVGTGAPIIDGGATLVEPEAAVLRLPARYRADTAAYRSYLRGLTLRFKFRFTESRDTLAALVDREPLYVPGLYGLAHALAFTALNDLTDPAEAWPKVHALALQSLALDSTAASAWLALAAEDMFERSHLESARSKIDRARRLDPANPDAALMLSVWFRFHAEMDSAVAEARRAHALDPLSVLFTRLVGKQLYFGRRYEEAWQVYAGMLHDEPGWQRGYRDMQHIERLLGRPRAALEWARRARIAEGDAEGAAALATAASDSAAVALMESDTRRRIAQLDSAVRNRTRVPPSHYASLYAALGDTTATLQWLDSMQVLNDSYLHQIRVDPDFDFLRGDPRYRAWESRSGLPRL